ncbi:hypothetical protein NAEGRDRAFT_65922 [Naegleria gruberi]|uniref:Uncharacterized protein n=1 Tax=Naegleria gruberi TaxID=5762 RepID=D2VAN8_NAEGR|nr:uncharacterized protein NAEGRDRAFT_65922 [Naegleria gruberi]EFC45986.1 hypothetical protein NAEGRDRAFT_65922 [Naegleria gruberi]|eukprot:XP_002678730.1 hypothetical protein NAEGRDRAFT_65922 [Naegleria gruberi strain NEG-M]
MPSPSSLKIIIENEQGLVSRCIQQDSDSEIMEHTLNTGAISPHPSESKCSVEKDEKLSLLFSRLGLKNNSPSPIIERSPTSFQTISTDHSNHNLQVNSSFPLLLAPSNKNRKSRMVFSTPSEEGESTVREILSTLSSRFHSAIESKSSSCITKQKKMKSSSSSSHRFCKSFDSC